MFTSLQDREVCDLGSESSSYPGSFWEVALELQWILTYTDDESSE